MTTLTITDLPRVDTMRREAMSAIRGGIAHVTLPGSESKYPVEPPSLPKLPGLPDLKDLHIPVTWPTYPSPQTQDPRLL